MLHLIFWAGLVATPLVQADAITDAAESAKSFERYKAGSEVGILNHAEETREASEAYSRLHGENYSERARATADTSDWNNPEKISRSESIAKFGSVIGSIPDPDMADQERMARLKRGLEKDDQLYVFVSRSMPAEMIQSYALEAAYAGGILVVRGINNNETLDEFLKGQMVTTLKPGGQGAMLQVDPRLFDAFAITTVPAIVYTGRSLADLCSNGTSTKCEPLPESDYFKMGGSVTIRYALDQFSLAGAEGAQRFRKALSDGYRAGSPDNPNLVAGIDSKEYAERLAKLTASMAPLSTADYHEGSHIPKQQLRNTPFGPMEMPLGTKMFLESVGGIKTIHQGVQQ